MALVALAKLTRGGDELVGGDPGAVTHLGGRVLVDRPAKLPETVRLRVHEFRVVQTLVDHQPEHAGCDRDVLARSYLQMAVGQLGGLGAAGIDDDESQSATLGVVERLDGVDLRPTAGARDDRVAPEDERDLGVHRVDGTAAPDPHQAEGERLAGLVDRHCVEHAPVADRLHERRLHRPAALVGEAARADVRSDGERTVLIEDRPQLRGDLLHGDVHRDGREGTVRETLLRMEEPVR